MKRLRYIFSNWKLGAHLLFRTKRFGVNNEWWSSYDSMFGYSFIGKIWNVISIVGLIDCYQAIKFRAVACHFLSDENKILVYGHK